MSDVLPLSTIVTLQSRFLHKSWNSILGFVFETIACPNVCTQQTQETRCQPTGALGVFRPFEPRLIRPEDRMNLGNFLTERFAAPSIKSQWHARFSESKGRIYTSCCRYETISFSFLVEQFLLWREMLPAATIWPNKKAIFILWSTFTWKRPGLGIDSCAKTWKIINQPKMFIE